MSTLLAAAVAGPHPGRRGELSSLAAAFGGRALEAARSIHGHGLGNGGDTGNAERNPRWNHSAAARRVITLANVKDELNDDRSLDAVDAVPNGITSHRK